MLNPTIGRLGKARRRKQVRKHCKAENINNDENTEDLSSEIDKRMRLNGNGTREDFLEFCRAAFERLSVESVAENAVEEIWREIEPKTVRVVYIFTPHKYIVGDKHQNTQLIGHLPEYPTSKQLSE